jgi:hypothetical protein
MWYRNVREAFLALFVQEGLLPFLVQLDRLGNALCGGNAKTTVSGRTGFYTFTKKNPYWKLMAKIIDFTFYPVDGPNHCYIAWKYEKNLNHRRGNDIGLTFLSLIILLTCPIICIFTYGSRLWDGLVGLVQRLKR